ncbi:MAG: hypothetical protein WB660_26505 [Candidatus Sulfotelmatobacter sp.]
MNVKSIFKIQGTRLLVGSVFGGGQEWQPVTIYRMIDLRLSCIED